MSSRLGGQAVVLGGSMAGLMAARALADHFQHVTILERDPLPETAGPRKGVPQGKHTHGLLASGLGVLEQYFPGIRDELVARGSLIGDIVRDSLWHVQGDFHARPESGLIGTTQSRPLLESVVRRRVLGLPNVTLRDRVSAQRLVTDPARRHRVIGVDLTDRCDGCGETLHADLVIDATGRGSRMPQWLADLGYGVPREERIEVRLTYATRTFRRKPDDFGGAMAVVFAQHPPCRRFGVAVAIEQNRWTLTLGGMFDEVPPTDDAGFCEFARGLPGPQMHQFLQTAEPLSNIETYKYPASLRRRYERLWRFPAGLLVLGDALCSFNPIYGQGMSTAALEAVLLGKLLRSGTHRLAQRFFRGAAKLIDVPWQIAATADFQFPQVRGNRPRLAGLVNAYLRLVHQAAHRDPVVTLAFHRVANLLDKPTALFRPRILSRVLSHGWHGGEAPAACLIPESPTQPPQLVAGSDSTWNLRLG